MENVMRYLVKIKELDVETTIETKFKPNQSFRRYINDENFFIKDMEQKLHKFRGKDVTVFDYEEILEEGDE